MHSSIEGKRNTAANRQEKTDANPVENEQIEESRGYRERERNDGQTNMSKKIEKEDGLGHAMSNISIGFFFSSNSSREKINTKKMF